MEILSIYMDLRCPRINPNVQFGETSHKILPEDSHNKHWKTQILSNKCNVYI